MTRETKEFIFNGYMNGLCPRCEEWEAPITTKELLALKDKNCHIGSTRKVTDPKAQYYRQVWREFFKCPNCGQNIAISYSSV